ncbi:hypothetical protein B0A48_15146 [Cryoendolithus antarcticus]|uniref:Uncharacterized protein n=1 Tax=Cryoendolithus antarcticus TaxID=1507870 RepID=A0A1V8SIL4_9PEZI|nr:hypothetical protein B0A48_15146 [Cryoendolithus antarcticus]OQO20613.1 hypothetical protein B0A51_11474 [Rachicladosporium sp. CCFEE 5018]
MPFKMPSRPSKEVVEIPYSGERPSAMGISFISPISSASTYIAPPPKPKRQAKNPFSDDPDADTLVGDEEEDDMREAVRNSDLADGFRRPVTPDQGENHNPWTSYWDLPRDHPVFSMSDETRNKLMKKGVDPVMRARHDACRGKLGVQKKGFFGQAIRMSFVPGGSGLA